MICVLETLNSYFCHSMFTKPLRVLKILLSPEVNYLLAEPLCSKHEKKMASPPRKQKSACHYFICYWIFHL